ncbi:hypothetical protein KOR42_27990 [Thalassoglobus neptunius]|uniref:Uncharacterized protein n=1 Tax=Thalassoglobus neptunius TaxID=1938619 RepID=A0A5C5WZU5_9PLAN|nr:hypothetical protein [Thalassoglobus neptunius]TWT55413.1 hypothetical protein KOR42_27990 [Thalassoglobus neptunius]
MNDREKLINLTGVCLLALCLLALSVQAQGQDDAQASPSQKSPVRELKANELEGTYRIIKGEMDGKEMKPEELKAQRVVFTDQQIKTLDAEDGELYVAKFQLQPHELGAHIVMESIKPPMPGIAAVGLIQKDEDVVKLIYGFPNAEAPDDFKTQKGQHMFVMLKQSDPKA